MRGSRIRNTLTIAALLARLAVRPVDLTAAACLMLWRSRPAIVVVMEDPDAAREDLVGRIHTMFPF